MGKGIEYYLAKGFDKKMAEYFVNGRRRIVKVVPNEDFTLTLTFDSGEVRLYDMSPYLRQGTTMAFLSQWENFKRVYLDENHCVSWDIDENVDSRKVWSNKVDICPDVSYVDSIPVVDKDVVSGCLFKNDVYK